MENTFMIFDSVKNEVKATHCSREQVLKIFEYLINQYTDGRNTGNRISKTEVEPRFQIMKRATPIDLF